MITEPNHTSTVLNVQNHLQEISPSISIETLLKEPTIPAKMANGFFYSAIVLGLFVMIYSSISGNVFNPLLLAVQEAHWSRVIVSPSILWAFMGTIFLAFRTVLWLLYRPAPSVSPDSAPALTVIIPAFNEGPMVKKAIYSVLSASYPREKLEIFVVDDGSRDDTWSYIKAAFIEYPNLVTAVRFPENRGKRAALEEGFRRARGEIVVTVDSDSVIEKKTLLAIAGPFRDAKIGAVAGKVVVFNKDQGIIPRMLQVRYILAFDMLRAVQSTYATVYCCPGALSAYRTSVIREILDEWIGQTFLGVACTYGEDRSLTNFILSRGYNTVYQRTAQVHTVVPWTYNKLCKMYLRWDRSYVRETIRFSKILWKRPLWSRMVSFVDLFITNLRYPLGYINLGLFVVLSVQQPATVLRLFCAIGLLSMLNMFYYLKSERSWDFLYGILYSYFSFLGLFWIFPYAFFTVRSRSWMTR
jgi:hyaluronan synthase